VNTTDPKIKLTSIPVTQTPSLPPLQPFSDEWFIVRFLEPWTAEDIRYAIDNNINLWDLVTENPEASKGLLDIASKYDASEVGVKDIQFWFMVRLPHLYRALVERQEGILWLRTNMTTIKAHL